MIIRSIRLKNIKSYGEEPDGKGVTVDFMSGINCIAGKNGDGKTTLIESLGYALFLTKPIYEENFDFATYLLRAGCKAGEIDVVFEMNGQKYRLERGLGSQSKRRAKVILVEDGSVEAENDEEVAKYLCRLCQFPDATRLSELFSKLVGVKQGRLTWPFDSKPTEARKYFEPLLDVEIFRECFDRLKPVIDKFQDLQHERDNDVARVEERIRERADSPQKAEQKEREADEISKAVEKSKKEKETADKQKKEHEQKEQVYRDAKSALDASDHSLKLANQKQLEDHRRVQESQEAAKTVKANQSAYEAYLKADQALRELQNQQNEKAKLQKERATADKAHTARTSEAKAARKKAQNYTEQKDEKTKTASQQRQEITTAQKQFLAGQRDFEQLEADTETARGSHEGLEHWGENLKENVHDNAELLQAILSDWKKLAAWDSQALTEARNAEKSADKTAKVLAKTLAEAEKLKTTLSEQLRQICGGVCPFLNEKCQQFDPGKIQSNVSEYENQVKHLRTENNNAINAHQKAKALVERLGQEEAKLEQLRRTVERDVEGLIATHNRLFPQTMRKHL